MSVISIESCVWVKTAYTTQKPARLVTEWLIKTPIVKQRTKIKVGFDTLKQTKKNINKYVLVKT